LHFDLLLLPLQRQLLLAVRRLQDLLMALQRVVLFNLVLGLTSPEQLQQRQRA